MSGLRRWPLHRRQSSPSRHEPAKLRYVCNMRVSFAIPLPSPYYQRPIRHLSLWPCQAEASPSDFHLSNRYSGMG